MAGAPTPSDFRTFDVHAKDVRIDADRTWECLRNQSGLARSEALGGFYLISRYAELKQALLDHGLFSSAQGIVVPDQGVRSMHIPAEIDPPAQRAYRAIMAKHFTPDRVAKLAPRIRQIVTSLLDRIAGETHVDFVDAFARPLPVHVSLTLLGLPQSDAQHLDALVVALHEEVATGVRQGASDKLTAYVRDTLVARTRDASLDDNTLVSDIICGNVDGRQLTLDEQVSMVRLILVGGFDSTAIALATAVWWLAQEPGDFERLRAEPALIDTFNEDVVRFASPATYLRRTVSRDVAFGGEELKAGDRVVLAFGAANRDPAEFQCPDRVTLHRKPNNHLGFGFGAHRCIGSWVAKAEMKIAIEELLARYASISLDASDSVAMSSGLNQGIVRLPIVLKPKGG